MGMKDGVPSVVSAETYRTAGLFTLISAFILVEGTVRTAFLVNTPSGAWAGDHYTFPPAAMIAASSVEVLFGLTGLAVGLAQVVFNVGSPLATIVSIACQCLGWYTFTVYTIAAPAYDQANAAMSLYSGLNMSQSEAITSMGILGSIGVCFSLQGSQFFLAFKLLNLQKGNGAIYNAEYHRSRLIVFTVAVLIAGGAQLTTGAILQHALGSGQFTAPIISPPHMVFYPALTITTGILQILYGLLLVVVALGAFPKARSTAFLCGIAAAFVFVCEEAFQNLGQSYAGGAAIIVNSQLVGLTFCVIFFPAYLVSMLCSEEGEMVVPEMGGNGNTV